MMSAEIFTGLDFHAQKNYLKKIKDDYMEADYMDFVMTVVTEYFNISEELIRSKSQKREVIMPRQIAIYFMYVKNIFTLKQIGSYFNKDHSTILYSKDTVKDLIYTDKTYSKKVIDIERLLE